MIKVLDYEFPKELRGLYQAIYYNDFAIFVVRKIAEKDGFINKYKESESFIASYIQNNPALLEEYFPDKEVIWDIYLILIIDFEIDLQEKIEIENDRFYCKKVIVNNKLGLESKDYLKYLSLFTTFQGDSSGDGFMSQANFEKELLTGMEFEELTGLFNEQDFISLEADDIKGAVDSWLTGVDKDVST